MGVQGMVLVRVARTLVVGLLLLCSPHIYAVESLDEMVEMPDGVKLYTKVLLPDLVGTFTTVVLRTPYLDDVYLDYVDMASNLGYAALVQHTRGVGKSEGENEVFFTDAVDGPATLEWLIEQPWSDGTYFLVGGSALGMPAYFLAPNAPQGMIGQAIAIATPEIYDHGVFHGGVFKEKDVQTWLNWMGASDKLSVLSDHRYCDDYWAPVCVSHLGPDTHSPSLHLGGWWDVFSEGTLAAYAMYSASDDPYSAESQHLIMGPWTHHKLGQTAVGAFTYPGNASLNFISTLLVWLDWCVDGDNNAVENWAPVRYYVMGDVDDPEAPGNMWRTAEDWPVPVDETPLYFHPEGALSFDALNADEAVATGIVFDPNDPSPTKGGRNLVGSAGPRDQTPVEERSDAFVMTTAELDEPIEIAGRVTARVTVSVEALDADVAVRVTDVFPDGRSMLVTEGIQRLSMRSGCVESVAVEANLPYAVDVDLWTTAYAFNTGHKIRVVITGSNYPRYELNPSVVAGGVAITLDISSNESSPSFISLPVFHEPEPDPEAEAEAIPELGPEPLPESNPEPSLEVVDEVVDAGSGEMDDEDVAPDDLCEAENEPWAETQAEKDVTAEALGEVHVDAGADVQAEHAEDAAGPQADQEIISSMPDADAGTGADGGGDGCSWSSRGGRSSSPWLLVFALLVLGLRPSAAQG
jgi:uncharacterized protein